MRGAASLIQGLVLAGLLGGLAVAAPIVNGEGAAPRSVFLRLPDTEPAPTVALRADPLATGGWRLTMATEGFRFTDICVTEAEAIPVGHAHIVLDGAKLTSAYGPIVEIAALPPGRHRVEAVLRGQDHRALLGRDGLVRGEVVIEVASQ